MSDNNSTISDYDLLEASLCLWETFIEDMPSFPEINALNWKIRIAGLRVQFTDKDLLTACHRGWEILCDEFSFDEPFDIEYCPAFLAECVVSKNGYTLALRDDWEDKCRKVIGVSL